VLSPAAPANFTQEASHEQVCCKPHKLVADNVSMKAHCCTKVSAFQTDFLA